MIGEVIITDKGNYTITEAIAVEGREHAHIYLCVDDNGNKFVAKHFFEKHPSANIGYAKINHFGRRRDGSDHVFREIQSMNERYDFLIKHHARAPHKKKWVIILEYVPGITLKKFIESHYKTNMSKVREAVAQFAKVVEKWHRNGFAHGDPHTDNAIIIPETMNVVLIDYSQIHHPEFHYCEEYKCFEPDPLRRVREDIENEEKNLGDGFRTHLQYLQDELQLGTQLTDVFEEHYIITLNSDTSL